MTWSQVCSCVRDACIRHEDGKTNQCHVHFVGGIKQRGHAEVVLGWAAALYKDNARRNSRLSPQGWEIAGLSTLPRASEVPLD